MVDTKQSNTKAAYCPPALVPRYIDMNLYMSRGVLTISMIIETITFQ